MQYDRLRLFGEKKHVAVFARACHGSAKYYITLLKQTAQMWIGLSNAFTDRMEDSASLSGLIYAFAMNG